MDEKPLVSIGVVAYNASKYIIETLESIKNQDYENLELIISDDCSQDDTVPVCEKWIKNNTDRFKRVLVLKSNINTGVSANLNRTHLACAGKWTKTIAGDDLLLPNCISTYIEFVQRNPEQNVVFANVKRFVVVNGEKKIIESPAMAKDIKYIQLFNDSDAHDQFRMLLRDGCLPQAPSFFCKTSFKKEHPYTEKYKYQEDYPMWLKLTKEGNRLHILDTDTVMYRMGNSLSNRKEDYYSRKYMSTRELFFWNECFEYYVQENLPDAYDRYRKILLRYELTEAFFQNRKTKFNSMLLKVLDFFIKRFAHYDL